MNRKLITILLLMLALFATFSITPAFAHAPEGENGTDNAPVNPNTALLDTPAADAAIDAILTKQPVCGAHPDHDA